MAQAPNYTKAQLTILVILRWILGFHFLFEGLNKLLSPAWTSAGFLLQANWLFADFFHGLTNTTTLLYVVDLFNIWGQILIGMGLVLGAFSKWAAYAGAFLLLLYYVAIPPFLTSPSFIDKNLIELFTFLVVAIFPTSQIIGVDLFLQSQKRKNYDPTR